MRTARPTRRNAFGLLAGAAASACRPLGSARHDIQLLVGSGAGSASDTIARLFAPHWIRRFSERMSVEDEPRGGGKVAAARLARGHADGGLIALLPTGLLYAQLVDPSKDWDLASLAWLGSLSMDRRVIVAGPKSGLNSFEDVLKLKRPLALATTSAASPGFYEAQIVNHLTGSKLKSVPGFPGGSRNLAFLSGEVDALLSSLDGIGELMHLPSVKILLRLNDLPLPNGLQAPLLADFAHGPDRGPLLQVIEAHARLGRIAALPPHAPAALVARLRSQFSGLMADGGFVRDAAAHGFPIEPTAGEAVNAHISAILAKGAGARAALDRALACGRLGAACGGPT